MVKRRFVYAFQCGILGKLWYLIVSIPDLCHLSYFDTDSVQTYDQLYGVMNPENVNSNWFRC